MLCDFFLVFEMEKEINTDFLNILKKCMWNNAKKITTKKIVDFRGVFTIMSNIYDEVFCENGLYPSLQLHVQSYQ